MDWLKLIEGTVGGLSLVAILVIVSAFLRHLKERDKAVQQSFREEREACRECRMEHNRTVVSHIQHSTEALGKVTAALDALTHALSLRK